MSLAKNIADYWELLVGAATAIGGVFSWFSMREKKKQESTQMLYEQMEKLKQKVILQVSREVEQATEIAERDRIIQGLRNHCPECYERFMKTIQK